MLLIGSGPSLRHVDPRQLRRFDTIAFNRSYLAWKDWGFAPVYHACLDPSTMAIIGRELPAVIAAFPDTHFFLHRNATSSGVEPGRCVTLVELMEGTRFSESTARLTDFGNVGAISLQLLALLGYARVLMVGVDGHYAPESESGEDVNHFRDDYAAGRIPLNDMLRHRYTAAWPMVAAECRRCGLDVRNASPGTALSCFAEIDFPAGLEWLSQPPANSSSVA